MWQTSIHDHTLGVAFSELVSGCTHSTSHNRCPDTLVENALLFLLRFSQKKTDKNKTIFLSEKPLRTVVGISIFISRLDVNWVDIQKKLKLIRKA